ncbi:hypothetical protein QWY16_09550 [Planococcus shenhongbingii]|uniref:hypothetical protein n=1 Tax=Planococcus shenhongbingii TaxID=3058398 RepID=UPI00262365FA|nr:hypothetical protein [Planococcus sp. N016]WKA60327.1 hypothetical protein QWY16_09550 [Planococcus sp. N016]
MEEGLEVLSDLLNKEVLYGLPTEVIITFFVTLFLIFLGINDDVKNKPYQKKNLLVMYLLLFITTFFFENVNLGIIFFLLIWYISGIALLQSDEITLERELGVFKLFHYTTSLWMFTVKSYILLICAACTIVLRIIGPEFINIPTNYLIILTILLFYLVHFIKNTLDYFGINRWEDVKHKIEEGSRNYEIDISNLSFLYYMEDKNLFKRESVVYGFYDIREGAKRSMKAVFNRPILKVNEKWNDKFRRGYSTVEQQVTRRTFLKENSYRYTIRRKLFVERTLNKAFVSAWCKKKAREYKKNDQKKAEKKLKFSVKYHYLRYYHAVILGNPSDINELIERMNRQSRVSIDLYKRIFENYQNSGEKNIYEQGLKDIKENEKNYTILSRINN